MPNSFRNRVQRRIKGSPCIKDMFRKTLKFRGKVLIVSCVKCFKATGWPHIRQIASDQSTLPLRQPLTF